MRDKFPGYFAATKQEAKSLWSEGWFVFDANVLLNLYRYSDKTREDFLEFLGLVQHRIWLPHQAAFEYLNNRASVIRGQIDAYKKAHSDISKLKSDFSGARAHPFISEKVQLKFDSAVSEVEKELSVGRERQEGLISEDPICDRISRLFGTQVGDRFSQTELESIYEDGAKRFSEKIPPGYKDGAKHPDPKTDAEKRSNFGDLVLWRQVLKFVEDGPKSIVFVTDDRKEDWWAEAYGRTLGPRPELVEEFVEKGGKLLNFATPDRFLQLGKNELGAKVSRDSIDEVVSEQSKREKAANLANRQILRAMLPVGVPQAEAIDKLRRVSEENADLLSGLPNGDLSSGDDLGALIWSKNNLDSEIMHCEKRLQTNTREIDGFSAWLNSRKAMGEAREDEIDTVLTLLKERRAERQRLLDRRRQLDEELELLHDRLLRAKGPLE